MHEQRYYYVYHLPASYQHPGWHYAYYELGMPLHEYPDSHLYHPISIYCLKHDEYMDIDYFYSRRRRSIFGKMVSNVGRAVKKLVRVSDPFPSPPSRYPPTRIPGSFNCFSG